MGSKAILNLLLAQNLNKPDKVTKVLLRAAIDSLRAENVAKSSLLAGLLDRHLSSINGMTRDPIDVRGLRGDIRIRKGWPTT